VEIPQGAISGCLMDCRYGKAVQSSIASSRRAHKIKLVLLNERQVSFCAYTIMTETVYVVSSEWRHYVYTSMYTLIRSGCTASGAGQVIGLSETLKSLSSKLNRWILSTSSSTKRTQQRARQADSFWTRAHLFSNHLIRCGKQVPQTLSTGSQAHRTNWDGIPLYGVACFSTSV
jgi:hypothetical protein